MLGVGALAHLALGQFPSPFPIPPSPAGGPIVGHPGPLLQQLKRKRWEEMMRAEQARIDAQFEAAQVPPEIRPLFLERNELAALLEAEENYRQISGLPPSAVAEPRRALGEVDHEIAHAQWLAKFKAKLRY
jgi:hypothetical protein